jgi:hypothetical protein
MQHFYSLSPSGSKFDKFPIFLIQLSRNIKSKLKIAKWQKFNIVTVCLTIHLDG